jgi:hypothetical protein
MLEEFDYGRFCGKSIELEGVGMNQEISTVEGFLKQNLSISR